MKSQTLLSITGLLGAALLCPVSGFSQNYTLSVLASDGSVTAAHTDANLVNGWGMSRSSGSPWWISDNATGKSTLYDSTGAAQSLIVAIPSGSGSGTGTPSGTIYNGTQDFQIAAGMPAVFLFATEDGTVSGWNPGVDPANAVIMINNPGAVYKGLTTAWVNGSQYLYLVNFASGQVEAYDATFKPVVLWPSSFQLITWRDDPLGPFEPTYGGLSGTSGFAPYNIQNIGGTLFIVFAKPDAARHDSVSGEGLGAVAAFDPTGRLLKIFQLGAFLNAPWGIAMAPSDFGSFSHTLLIGNFGSGQIVAYDTVSGQMAGLLADANNQPITIDGLWGLGFGNGGKAGPYNTLFFTAGPNGEANGEFGSLTPVAATLTAGNDL